MKNSILGSVLFLVISIASVNANEISFASVDSIGNALIHQELAFQELEEEMARAIAAQTFNQDSAAHIYWKIGLSVKKQHDFDLARRLINRAFSLLSKESDPLLRASMNMTMADMAMEEDETIRAIELQSLALAIYEKEKDSVNYLLTLRKIGVGYDYFGDHESARKYYDECIVLAKQLDREDVIGNCYNTIAGIYNDTGEYQEAIKYYDRGLEIAYRIKDEPLLSKLLHNISIPYQRLELFSEAGNYLHKAMNLAHKRENQKSIGFANQGFGFHYLRRGILDSSEYFMDRTLEIGSSINNAQLVANAQEVLDEIYLRQGRFEEAYRNLKEAKAQDDSLFNIENSAILQSMRGKYEAAQKERELAEASLKLIEADYMLERQRGLQTALIIGVILLIFIVILMYVGYHLRQKANNLLRAKNEEIEQLNRTKSRWFVNVAHELRTPLTLIKSPVSRVLSQYQLESEVRSDLELVDKSATNLSNLVNEILDLSRMESGKIALKETTFSIYEFVEQVVNSFASKALHQGVHLSFECTKDIEVKGDKPKLHKVLVNLLSNSFKFTNAGGSVTVKVIFRKRLWIDVIDTGIGIKDKDLPRVFDRFFQTEDSDEQMQGGTGIGLALSKEITNLHGGELTVVSQFGKGSSFKMCLPRERVIHSV